MCVAQAASRKRASGKEYRADAARHVVRRSDKAKFGVSLAPHSPGSADHFGTRTVRTHQPHWKSGSLKGSRLLDEEHIPTEHRRFLNNTCVVCCDFATRLVRHLTQQPRGLFAQVRD